MQRCHLWLRPTWAGLLAATLGCGGAQPQTADPNAEAKAKVEAFNQLADAMSQDANGPGARAALENFRITMLDVGKNRAEAEAIVETYRKRIKGKYQGEVAQDVQLEVAPIESALKQSK